MQRRHTTLTFAISVALMLAAAACGDTVGPEADDYLVPVPVQIASARLTIWPDNVITTLDRGSAATITLPPGTATVTITAEWLDAAGRSMSGFSPAELELSITGREFTTEPGTFTGTISGLYIGSHPLTIRAWHRQEARVVFGAVLYLVVKESDVEVETCNPAWDFC